MNKDGKSPEVETLSFSLITSFLPGISGEDNPQPEVELYAFVSFFELSSFNFLLTWCALSTFSPIQGSSVWSTLSYISIHLQFFIAGFKLILYASKKLSNLRC